jgi:hypothetical protein
MRKTVGTATRTFLVLIAIGTGAGIARSPVGQEVDYQPVIESVFSHMAITYVCRKDLGGIAHYQAARTIAIGTIARLVGEAEAIVRVDEMDHRFKSDPRAEDPEMPPGACIVAVNESLYKISVEKAKAGLMD